MAWAFDYVGKSFKVVFERFTVDRKYGWRTNHGWELVIDTDDIVTAFKKAKSKRGNCYVTVIHHKSPHEHERIVELEKGQIEWISPEYRKVAVDLGYLNV